MVHVCWLFADFQAHVKSSHCLYRVSLQQICRCFKYHCVQCLSQLVEYKASRSYRQPVCQLLSDEDDDDDGGDDDDVTELPQSVSLLKG